MADQNSTVEHQIRPEALRDELGIKKDSYYNYLKALDIKAEKDSEGKAYLTETQANLMRALRSHVLAGGKIEEFDVSNGDAASLALAEKADLTQDAGPDPQAQIPGFDMDKLVRGAAELAGHRMTVAQQLMLQMADQMTYEDLPEEVQAKVDGLREATNPKQQNLSVMASDLLSQWRAKRQELQTA